VAKVTELTVALGDAPLGDAPLRGLRGQTGLRAYWNGDQVLHSWSK